MVIYSVLEEFFKLLKSGVRKYKWHKVHPNSDTIPMTDFSFQHVQVGNGSYGELNIIDYGKESEKNHLLIRNYVSIAQNVTFILNAEHYTNRISAYPFKVKMLKSENAEAFGKGNIVVDDDVWIGFGSTILSGVHIGQGAVIAAGAVVSKDVPPYAIVGGVPAKVIKYRFSDELIQELMKVDYSKLTREMVEEHIEDLYSELKDSRQLFWMPKKAGMGIKK